MYTKKNGRMTYKSNRRTNFKRNNNYASKGRNRGTVTQQYNKYLKLAKDTFSAGDRIQAEYYYQFTDHYYRLMLELGINLEEQENSSEIKDTTEENSTEEKNQTVTNSEEKINDDMPNDQNEDQSIESIPFMAEPVKKKRARTTK